MAKKMTAEEILAANGFKADKVTEDGRTIYAKTWKKTSQVSWVGEMEETLEVRLWVSYGYALVNVYRNGRREDHLRDYSSVKRAMRAISEIARCADFEM